MHAVAHRAEGTAHHAVGTCPGEFRGRMVGEIEILLPGHFLKPLHAAAGLLVDVLPEVATVVGVNRSGDVAAQRHSLAYQAVGFRHRYQRADLCAAAGLPHYGHIGGVSAESRYVLVHPAQRGHYVKYADVAGIGETLVNCGEIREADGAQPVVHRDEDHVAVTAEILPVVAVLLDGVAVGEAAAMNPEQHGTLLRVRAGSPDIQRQAVLPHVIIVPVVGEGGVAVGVLAVHPLRSDIAIEHGRADIVPGFHSLGRHEAVLPRCGGCVGYSQISVDSSEDIAADASCRGVDDGDRVSDEQLLSVGARGKSVSGCRTAAAGAEQQRACQDRGNDEMS